MNIHWSEQALSDAEDLRDFIARDAPAFAELFVDRVFEAVERLSDFPMSGRIVPEFRRPDLREVLLGSYRIVYHVVGDTVSVATVCHAARLLGPQQLSGITAVGETKPVRKRPKS
ncbi:MAG TPA: type II toxin-antitoxin system RelE/ParE family toxin [Longimicrobium sp.]|nr:type II toxin-antitoxin system RelE/ParE family toxin [Longimicrobium sp.]